MLDDWLERMTREPPEKRAKRQLRDVGKATRHTVKALAAHPTDRQAGDILHTHKVRVAEIQGWGRQPPPARCRVCGKLLPKPIANPWSNNPGIGLIWSILVAVLLCLLFPVLSWWVLALFPVSWLLSQTFVWSVALPGSIVFVLLLFLEMSGIVM
jgi:hypothetical protein